MALVDFSHINTQTYKIRVSFSGKQCRGLRFTSRLRGGETKKSRCLLSSSPSFLTSPSSPHPSTVLKYLSPSEEADQALALLDLLLHLVAGGGDLGLRREDGADEGEHGAAHGSVEGPAHGAEPGPVRSRVRAAVQLDLV